MSFKNTLFFVLVVYLLTESLYHVSAEKNPATASVNVSTVYVGDAITLRCDIDSETEKANKVYGVFFNTAGIDIASYQIKTSSNKKEKAFELYKNDSNIAKILPQETNTSTAYEIAIFTKTAFSTQYKCQFYQHDPDPYSNAVSISAIEKPAPQAPTLNSSVSHVKLNNPFTLTCTLPSTFNAQHFKYSVAFYNNRDGLLANYEVDQSGQVFLADKEYANVSAHQGARALFPTFDVQVIEKADRKLSYWCNLVDSINQKSQDSVHWKSADGPYVDFESTANGNERRGRCTIDEFVNHTNYEVQFFSNLGPNGDNLLGYYSLKPNKVPEFVSESVTHWTSISHGFSKDYPNFEIIANVETGLIVSNHHWWCVLKMLEFIPDRLIKSNLATL